MAVRHASGGGPSHPLPVASAPLSRKALAQYSVPPSSGLFWKVFLAFWLATSLTFFVGLGVLQLGNHGVGDPQMEIILASEEKLLTQFGIDAGRQLLAVWEHSDDQAIGVYDAAGQLVAGQPVSRPAFERTLVSKDGATLRLKSSLDPDMSGGKGPGHSTPLLIGTVMSALFSGYMAFYLAWPLAYLRRAMREVAQGRFETRVRPMMGRRRDEIVDLAGDCDRMANQLKLLVDAQRQLLHDISHELRSPLTRMQAAIGLLRQAPCREGLPGRSAAQSCLYQPRQWRIAVQVFRKRDP